MDSVRLCMVMKLRKKQTTDVLFKYHYYSSLPATAFGFYEHLKLDYNIIMVCAYICRTFKSIIESTPDVGI